MKLKKLFLYILLVYSCCWSYGCNDKMGNEKHSKDIINVEVDQVKKAGKGQVISYSGTIEESESTPLSFSVVGTVSRVLVSEGDYVKKGQLLAVLNDESYKNIYDMSLAAQKRADDAYNRLLPMYKNGNLPEIKFVEVETGLQQAKSSTEIARKNIDDCKLYSPVDGIVGKRSIEPGMSALPNLTSITVVNIEKVFAKVPISEGEISIIKKGNKAIITIGALNDKEFAGTIEEIGVLADPIAHTYKIKIGILNNNRQIKPGMICNVIIPQLNENNRLYVPNSSVLVDEQGKNFVYVIYQNKAIKKYVKTGHLLKNGVEITEGLNETEQVVVTGQQKLVDSSTVNIINHKKD